MLTFEESNKKEHLAINEWHYPILIKYGFVCETHSGIGFVRGYEWSHPNGHRIRYNIGSSADYWKNLVTKDEGYWSSLEDHLKKLTLVDNRVN